MLILKYQIGNQYISGIYNSFEKTKAQMSDLHGTRPNSVSSMGPANASDLCRSKYEGETSERAGLSQWPTWDQDQGSNLCPSRTEMGTSTGTGPREQLLPEQA